MDTLILVLLWVLWLGLMRSFYRWQPNVYRELVRYGLEGNLVAADGKCDVRLSKRKVPSG